jgi:hypothetical protein
MTKQFKVIVEKDADGYVAYPRGWSAHDLFYLGGGCACSGAYYASNPSNSVSLECKVEICSKFRFR